jgi:cystathionine beta-lyase
MMRRPSNAKADMKDETKLITLGRQSEAHHGAVNVPVYHASTILFPSLDEHDARYAARRADQQVTTYGLAGTPTTFALENAVAALEGGFRAILFPSGLAAVAGALLASLKAGDHLLMVDSVYEPTRTLCDGLLRRFGIETTYYPPLIGAGIAALIRPNTAVVFVESPGSLTFEVQDVPAIAAAAHAAGALVVMDNTWASPLFFKPFQHGVDLSIQAGTKYLGGHSDVLIGTVTAHQDCWPRLRDTARHQLGQGAGPDDVAMTLRGMRTLAVRLRRQEASGLKIAGWLKQRPEVVRVLHPALPEDPGHAIWRRDFLGAAGLFGVELKPCPRAALAAMLDGLALFGMGYSWGGFESLIVWARPERVRTAVPWTAPGPLLRLSIGLEDPDDLIADLAAGFDRLAQADAGS